jgi:putative endonuclease
VLLSEKDNKFYIGYTSNLERRLKEHENGETPSTKYRRPFKLIFYEAYLDQQDALRREGYFKTTAGKRALKMMLRNYLRDNK